MINPSLAAHLRVNHAGEAGAVQIYRAQRWVSAWRAPSLLPILEHFQADEERHLFLFDAQRRRLGQSACHTLRACQVGGWALGAFSALWGVAGVAACTEAVEAVVLGHLRLQRVVCIEAGDLEALACLEAVIVDEQSHRDCDLCPDHRAWSYRMIHSLATHATRGVIVLGLRD